VLRRNGATTSRRRRNGPSLPLRSPPPAPAGLRTRLEGVDLRPQRRLVQWHGAPKRSSAVSPTLRRERGRSASSGSTSRRRRVVRPERSHRARAHPHWRPRHGRAGRDLRSHTPWTSSRASRCAPTLEGIRQTRCLDGSSTRCQSVPLRCSTVRRREPDRMGFLMQFCLPMCSQLPVESRASKRTDCTRSGGRRPGVNNRTLGFPRTTRRRVSRRTAGAGIRAEGPTDRRLVAGLAADAPGKETLCPLTAPQKQSVDRPLEARSVLPVAALATQPPTERRSTNLDELDNPPTPFSTCGGRAAAPPWPTFQQQSRTIDASSADRPVT